MTPGTRRIDTDQVAAAALLGLGLLYGWFAMGEGIGSLERPGAGFFPLLVAVVLVISAALVVRETRRSTQDDAETVGEDDFDTHEVPWPRVGGVLLAAFAVPVLADTSGFITTLSVAVVLIARVMGMRGLLRPLTLGVAFGAATWLIFVYWLFVPLPVGTLGLV